MSGNLVRIKARRLDFSLRRQLGPDFRLSQGQISLGDTERLPGGGQQQSALVAHLWGGSEAR